MQKDGSAWKLVCDSHRVSLPGSALRWDLCLIWDVLKVNSASFICCITSLPSHFWFRKNIKELVHFPLISAMIVWTRFPFMVFHPSHDLPSNFSMFQLKIPGIFSMFPQLSRPFSPFFPNFPDIFPGFPRFIMWWCTTSPSTWPTTYTAWGAPRGGAVLGGWPPSHHGATGRLWRRFRRGTDHHWDMNGTYSGNGKNYGIITRVITHLSFSKWL